MSKKREKSKIIQFRVSIETFEGIENVCKNYQINISEFIRDILMDKLLTFKELTPPLKKALAKYKGRIWRDNIYQMQNSLRNIISLNTFTYLKTGKVNMKIINKELDLLKERINCMDKETKEMLKEEIIEINKYRNEKYVMDNLRYLKDIKRLK